VRLEGASAFVTGGASGIGAVDATAPGRIGQPQDVAAAIAFLASEDAFYITGQTLGVSGGLSMS
jgi:2-hydroxycyclohexanecarboxyl-CoA dehydrogenase